MQRERDELEEELRERGDNRTSEILRGIQSHMETALEVR